MNISLYSVIPGRQMRCWEEKDGWEDVEEVEDGGCKHQTVEVPLHNGAEGEVNQATQIPNQPKEANDYLKSESEKIRATWKEKKLDLPEKSESEKWTVADLNLASLNQVNHGWKEVVYLQEVK